MQTYCVKEYVQYLKTFVLAVFEPGLSGRRLNEPILGVTALFKVTINKMTNCSDKQAAHPVNATN